MQKDSSWREESIPYLKDIESGRKLTERALSKIIGILYHAFIKKDMDVLEVGSGMGYLKSISPEAKISYRQLESSPDMIELARKRFYRGEIIEGSVYDIPFKDESQDVVIALGSYDVLGDLDIAAEETYRILKKGGHFIHILDTLPNTENLIDHLHDNDIEYEATSFIDAAGKEYLDSFNIYTGEGKKTTTSHELFESILKRSLSRHFRPENTLAKEPIDTFTGKKSHAQREYDRYSFVFSNMAGYRQDFSNMTQFNIGKKGFPEMLNPVPAMHAAAYRLIDQISRCLPYRIEPEVFELASVRVVTARK